MKIGNKFSVSADGRLQALPSLPPPDEPPGSPAGKSVLEEGGALQGVAAIAGNGGASRQSA